ncbi:hypothetical protein EVAR_77660_1 [Eumeta japonica]|uniref:Uncharacterized protein n=1 Tax=Eumeta variegata TaxID=151549 RepID=A0A4C1T7V5_EUMVA|nr:hypothetical protein EVAR_77660_1 [Eumeta japonica]
MTPERVWRPENYALDYDAGATLGLCASHEDWAFFEGTCSTSVDLSGARTRSARLILQLEPIRVLGRSAVFR